MSAYAHGQRAALQMFKLAKYLTEEDALERKMRRHMSADPAKELERLRDKGRASGESAGKFLGTLLGAPAGGYLGAGLAHLGGAGGFGTAASGVLGAALGGYAGHRLGGSFGGRQGALDGEQEFADRQSFADVLRQHEPAEQRRRIEQMFKTRRDDERMDMDRERLDMERDRHLRDWAYYNS